jgi:hypothetical protein
MTIEPEPNKGLSEKEITGVLDLLGAGFEDGGIVHEISFPDLDGNPVRIAKESNTGPMDRADVKLPVIEDIRFEIENI